MHQENGAGQTSLTRPGIANLFVLPEKGREGQTELYNIEKGKMAYNKKEYFESRNTKSRSTKRTNYTRNKMRVIYCSS